MINNSAAEAIRERVHKMDVAGLQVLADDVIKASKDALKNQSSHTTGIMPSVQSLLGRILSEAEEDPEVGRARLKAMLRYVLENGYYKADKNQLPFLLENGMLRHGQQLIDLGAEDISIDDGVITVVTLLNDWTKVRDFLKQKGMDILSAGLSYIPTQKTTITDEPIGEKLHQFIEAIEEDDDVSEVHTNVEES